MNVDATNFTRPFTSWPVYQQHEGPVLLNESWNKERDLSPDALNKKYKIDSAIHKVKDSIKNGKLSLQLREEIGLVSLRSLAMQNSMQREIIECKPLTIPLEKKIDDLANEITNVSFDFDTFETEAGSIVKTISELSLQLLETTAKFRTARENLLQEEIAKDRRCYKKYIKELDLESEYGLYPKKIEELISDWRTKTYCFYDVTNEECWIWKGRIKAYKILEHQMSHLANNLHAIASCFEALKENLIQDDFSEEPVELPEENNKQIIPVSEDSEEDDFIELVDFLRLLSMIKKR